ncbi:MAG: putative phage abortive infection protein [Nitrospira sp.]|nr:putative phage abortive infection protein [Nitrospira sp.]
MNQDEPNLSPPKPRNTNFTELIGWSGFVVVIFVWYGYGLWHEGSNTDSSFDRLNTLFSGLASWGVIFAILLQKSELALQRKELELTRIEVRGQKEQLEAQNVTLRKQNFENTFFSLISLYISIVDSVEIHVPQLDSPRRDVTIKGRECFLHLFHDLKREYARAHKEAANADDLALCISAYDHFAAYRQSLIGHYFSTLFKIIQFVDNSEFVDESEIEEKQIYINLLKAQLSTYELSLLFYNSLSNYGLKHFKLYIEKCGLLENLSVLLAPGHKKLYRESAFGKPS